MRGYLACGPEDEAMEKLWARSANNNFTENIISVNTRRQEKHIFTPTRQYSPTSAKITVSSGAIGNLTAMLNSAENSNFKTPIERHW